MLNNVEGTSYHYLPAADYSSADEGLVKLARDSLNAAGIVVQVGATWTTDAPFRETTEAIEAAREEGALLRARHQPNGPSRRDFEKGVAEGAQGSLRVVAEVAHRWRESRGQPV